MEERVEKLERQSRVYRNLFAMLLVAIVAGVGCSSDNTPATPAEPIDSDLFGTWGWVDGIEYIKFESPNTYRSYAASGLFCEKISSGTVRTESSQMYVTRLWGEVTRLSCFSQAPRARGVESVATPYSVVPGESLTLTSGSDTWDYVPITVDWSLIPQQDTAPYLVE